MNSYKYKTKNNILSVNLLFDSISVSEVSFDYFQSSKLCKSGCKNYNKKYSCPPNSPSFDLLIKRRTELSLLVVKIKTDGQKENYLTLKMLNSVARSIQNNFYNYIKETVNKKDIDYYLLGNGSCRSCKKCSLQLNEKCKKPDKISYSLEATGIDVNKLIEHTFNFKLEWYKIFNTSFPKYQCVVGGIINSNHYFIYETFLKWYDEVLLNNERVIKSDHEYQQII